MNHYGTSLSSDFTDDGRRVIGTVHAWLPGYSRDSRKAIVRVYEPIGFHIKTVTYMLEKVGGKWRVVWRNSRRY